MGNNSKSGEAILDQSSMPLVLIVDDDEHIREFIKIMLDGQCRLKIAADGEEALRLIHAEPPDMILLDLVMPTMDGRELLRQLRSNPATQDIPVIILTIYQSEFNERECLELGADDFIGKPLHKDSLVLKIHNMLQRYRLQRDLAISNARAQRIFEAAPDPMLIVNKAGQIIQANERAEQVFGYPPGEITGHSLEELLHAGLPNQKIQGNFATAQTPALQLIESGLELTGIRRNGEKFPMLTNLNSFKIGDELQIIVGVNDISERKASEAIIQRDRELQALLRPLLEEGFAAGTLNEILQRCLNKILAISWLAVLPKGGIFLADTQNKSLQLVVQQNLSPEIRTLCAHVPFGHCLCGRAAVSKEMQYAVCVDKRHEINFPGMVDHGHYNLPILAGETLLGVLVLYLPIGFTRDATKEEFLHSIANILAGIIQHKQDEMILQEREALYRNVVETSTDGFFMTDVNGRLLEVNASYERLSGYSRAELLKMHVADLEAMQSGTDITAQIEKIMQQGADLFESKHRASDGHVWPVEVSVSYLPMLGGRFFAFTRDITQREGMRQKLLQHRAELEEQVSARTAELESSRQQLASIIEHLPASLFIKDLSGHYQSVNRRYEQEVGVSREQVIGHTDHDIFSPGLAEKITNKDREVIEEGILQTFEESIPQRDGLRHDYLTTKLPLLDAQGKPYALLGVAVDITALKTLQTQLSRAQSIAHLGSWHFNIASSRLSLSDESYRIFGIPAGTPLRMENFIAHTHPEDHDRVIHAWESALQGKPYDVEHRIVIGDQIRWVRQQAEILFEEVGEPLLIDGSLQDITEIKHIQIELEAALSEAQRMMKVKSEFLANMSHEIRTPLNGILGLAQIGQRENAGRECQRLFDQVFNSGKILLGIVNDILDFSKIEAGKLQIETVDVELDRIIQHVSIMTSGQASAKGFLLRIETDKALPAWFKGDPLRIAQILINLVGNAIKFTERGEVVLSIFPEADHIVFSVHDTGIGMAPEHIEKLFTPFEQVDGSITRRFGGTGLGLAITQRLVNLMGGEIRVRSTLNVGSTFEVHLPLVAVNVSALVGQQPPSGAFCGQHVLAGLHILAAEDNAVNRMVLEDILTMEGATLFCAENGQAALDAVLREGEATWDIVLTDIHMPVMGGHELAQRLREIAPTLPVIGVTAHAMLEERQLCMDSGMVAHVAKPIVMNELVEVILRHARRQATGKPAAPVPVETTEPIGKAPPPAAISPGAEEAFIDWKVLLAQFQGRQAFVDKLLKTLLHSHTETPEKLRAAVKAADLETLAFVAHSFAGVAGQVRADSLRSFAKEVEQQAKAGQETAFDQAEELAILIERFLAIVQARMNPESA